MKLSIRLFVALFVVIAPIVFAADDPADITTPECLRTGYNWGGEPSPGNPNNTLLGIPGDICQGPINPENQIVNICHNVIVPVCYCPAGYSCAEGDDYPACKRCPPGHYCPYDGDYDPIECDEGYFCPEGSKAPRKCRSMDVCPAKSHSFVYLGGLVVDFILLVSLYAIIRIWKNSKNSSDASSIFVRNSISPGESEMQEIDKPKFMTFDLKFVDLGCTLEIKKGFIRKQITKIPILAGVTGELPHGKVTAVMGPSGAGKTTFLNVLCGKVPRTSGVVYINGREDDIERYTKVIGFVPQEDVMLRSFTVEEILTHSARIRLPRGTSQMEIKKKVDEVIQLLGLGECRHSIIGDEHQRGISGGQRKRVNIAMELVMSPSMLFLDEPTSGLDSSSAEECVRALQTIARLGINVIAVIHQPRVEIFRMFDTLLLLGKGGRTVYLGPPMDAVEYFQGLGYEVEENVNAPDWYMDITSGLVKNVTKGNPDPSHLFEEWDRTHPFVKPEPSMERKFTIANSKAYLAKKMRGDSSRRTPSFFEQVYIYICRGVIQSRHGFSRFCLDCFLFAFTGIYLGLAFVKPKMRLPITYQMRELCPAPIRQIPAHLAILDGEGGGVRDFCSICTPLEDRVGLMFFYMAMGVGLISAAVSGIASISQCCPVLVDLF
eukprot:TRINITY_DN5858_c0_g1_i1.p1 TRINITY_DN5858_c0_g1~~TRINITY_DN5858_c0_g1_i1.p1  ORF type:complete len:661 (-),score=115.98 TRINITY_DN5858_c0_g1_i1:1597-3579(-)